MGREGLVEWDLMGLLGHGIYQNFTEMFRGHTKDKICSLNVNKMPFLRRPALSLIIRTFNNEHSNIYFEC